MELKLKNIILLALLSLATTGCVKLNILPEDSVKNTFKAGKEMIDEASLKRKGGKKREYAKQVVLGDYDSEEEGEDACFNSLKETIKEESPNRDPVIVTTKIAIVPGLSDKAIECSISAFIWP